MYKKIREKKYYIYLNFVKVTFPSRKNQTDFYNKKVFNL